MRYLFSSILSLNIVFYVFLILKPLNIELNFSIIEGNNLSEIFSDLEEQNIYFPKAIKLVFNFSGIDKKISDEYLNRFNKDNKNLFNKIVLRKNVINFFEMISLD